MWPNVCEAQSWAQRKCATNGSNQDHYYFILYFPSFPQCDSIHLWLEKSNLRRKILKIGILNVFLFTCSLHFSLGIWNTSTDCSLKYLLLFENIVRLFLLRESSPFNAWKGLKCPCLQTLETISLFSNQSFYGIKKYYSFSSVFHPYTYTKVCWKSFSQQV